MNATKKPALGAPRQGESEATGRLGFDAGLKTATEATTKAYEQAMAMTKEQMNAFTKFGFGSFNGHNDWMAVAKDNVDALVKCGSMLAEGMQEMNRSWLGLAQSSMEDGMVAAKTLLECKTLPEMVQVQAEVTKASYAKWIAESRKLSEKSARLAEKSFAPIAERVNAAMERIAKPLAE